MKHKTSSADDQATGLPLTRLMNQVLAEACNARHGEEDEAEEQHQTTFAAREPCIELRSRKKQQSGRLVHHKVLAVAQPILQPSIQEGCIAQLVRQIDANRHAIGEQSQDDDTQTHQPEPDDDQPAWLRLSIVADLKSAASRHHIDVRPAPKMASHRSSALSGIVSNTGQVGVPLHDRSAKM